MKTKEELLKKYEKEEDIYSIINNNYEKNTLIQCSNGCLLFFDPSSMKDVVGIEKMTYAEYIDTQIITGNNFRGGFSICYFNIPMEFKGKIEKFNKNYVCFKRIYIEGMYSDGTIFESKENHVWMPIVGFENLNKEDNVSFFAEPYRYIKTGKGKTIDFGLRNPTNISKINYYELPSDEELIDQELNLIICETCYLSEQCSRFNCLRNSDEIKKIKKDLKLFLKNGN